MQNSSNAICVLNRKYLLIFLAYIFDFLTLDICLFFKFLLQYRLFGVIKSPESSNNMKMTQIKCRFTKSGRNEFPSYKDRSLKLFTSATKYYKPKK